MQFQGEVLIQWETTVLITLFCQTREILEEKQYCRSLFVLEEVLPNSLPRESLG